MKILRFKNNYIDKTKEFVLNNKLSYYIDTMGCSMNENDSSKYAGILETMGFIKSIDEESSNLILLNTCSIRENAENTLFGRLGALKNKKNTYIIVVGCMTEQKHILEKIKKSYSYVNIVLGTHSMQTFPEKIYNMLINKEKYIEYFDKEDIVLENVPIKFEDKNKASVSIIYGCNNFCTYCIVPYVRGRERSRLKEDIISDVKDLANKGYKEINLLGQNVNTYGKDLNNGTKFSDLLKEIEKIDGIDIIKFMSPHPKDFTDELIEVIANSKKISKQIHLPLQSGSSKILNLMNRKYTKESYLELVNKIKIKCKDVVFSTDIIVGFPYETEEDFLETLDVVNNVKFDQIFMYIYSKRIGTKAASMEDFTKTEEKVNRLQRLKELFKNITFENNENMLEKEYLILVEGKSKNNESYYTGRTNTNKIVIFEAKNEDIGKIKKVKIIKNNLWYLTGKII
ncbi:MAG: tRNA (N6-isopentenyl adenosine(37)-C2)-methylthiotransferase MiaB [Clostridia bacterium]